MAHFAEFHEVALSKDGKYIVVQLSWLGGYSSLYLGSSVFLE